MKVFSAVSSNKDAFAAGREAAEHAVNGLACRPDMFWAFGAITYDQKRLLEGIYSASKGVDLIGCTTDGEISAAGLSENSVVVLALASKTVQFHTTQVSSLSSDSYRAGVSIGESFKHIHCEYLQIFSDGLTGNAAKIVEGIRAILGDDIKIAGGTAGDGGFFVNTNQYYNDQVLTDSIVAVAFEGDFSFGTGCGCGWFPVGTAKKVTKAEENTLYELDGLPALQVYEKFLGRHARQLPAVGVEYPLGIVGLPKDEEDEGYFICRATMGVDRERQSIDFAGEIPLGSMVKMTMGNQNDVIEAARKAAKEALTDLEERSPESHPQVIFVFSCMARKIVLGTRISEEVAEIRKIVGSDVSVIGFYTYGEYAPSGRLKKSNFHNETMTLTIIGK